MFDLFEEMGITIGEIIGAALVFAGFAGGLVLLSKYGFDFIGILVG